MSRFNDQSASTIRPGLMTGTMCCAVEATRQFGMATLLSPWHGLYFLAYERAREQLQADQRRRVLLGHADPGMN